MRASSQGTHPRLTPKDNLLQAIGDTPLVRLQRYLDDTDIELYAKLESFNPGGSAKDRPALAMLQAAMDDGLVDANTTIIESSSGNMGIGLAQACRFYNLPLVCVVDPRIQRENLQIMQALGAQIEMVQQPIDGDFLAARISRVCELLEQQANSFWPNQYANDQNPTAHCHGTMAEIDQALQGQLDVLFVATSSTGTVQGCQRYLQQQGSKARVVAVDAAGSVLFGGQAGPRAIPGLGAGKIPKLAGSLHVEEVCRVSDLDCVVGCRRAAQREAMLIGGSAGGVLEAIRRQKHLLSGQRCVAILHDSGTRYLNTVFNDLWVEKHLHCPPARLARMVDGYTTPADSVAIS